MTNTLTMYTLHLRHYISQSLFIHCFISLLIPCDQEREKNIPRPPFCVIRGSEEWQGGVASMNSWAQSPLIAWLSSPGHPGAGDLWEEELGKQTACLCALCLSAVIFILSKSGITSQQYNGVQTAEVGGTFCFSLRQFILSIPFMSDIFMKSL